MQRSHRKYADSSIESVPVDALIVGDMQNGFLNGQRDLVSRVGDLARSFPADRTWWLKYRNHPDSLFTKHLHWSEVMVSPQTDIEPSLRPMVRNVMEHISYDPPEEMAAALEGCKHVGIAGTDTDACVQAAAFFLWRHNIFPVILQNHCGSSGGDNFHKVALDLMRRQFEVEAIVNNVTASIMALQLSRRPETSLSTPTT